MKRDLKLETDGFVTFKLEGQWLGIPVVLVQEVLPNQRVAPVPLSSREVAGFLNLRGQIVTAINVRARLGLPPRGRDEPHMHVVVREGEEFFSLMVDEVGDVVEVGEEGVEPTPKTLDAVWRKVCRGVVRLEESLLVILDVDEVLEFETARV